MEKCWHKTYAEASLLAALPEEGLDGAAGSGSPSVWLKALTLRLYSLERLPEGPERSSLSLDMASTTWLGPADFTGRKLGAVLR